MVLARKWRSRQFADVVGQSAVIRTLMNAIRADRIHQAYLLTGSRGIGKTSIARIFAKVLRCEQTQWKNDWIESCDQCSQCSEIAGSQSVDVIEIDGASNNGVDAVREIRENAKYLPSSGNKKIYIIDEVHMLTTAAFNALLKTLEEPPPHIVFIFATTESHKIPATILSRVQKFDLKRLTSGQIQSHLLQIAKSENISLDAASASLIARTADGGMRDALSLLDQVISFAGNSITLQQVRESLGILDGKLAFGVLKAIAQRKSPEALTQIDAAFRSGTDLKLLTQTVIELLHAAMLSHVMQEQPSSIELSPEEWAEISEIGKLRGLSELEMMFQVFHQGLEWMARAPSPKLVLDIMVIKCAEAAELVYATPINTPPTKVPAVAKPVAATQPTPAPRMNTAPATQEAAPAVIPAASTTPTFEGLIAQVRSKRPLLASVLENGVGNLPASTAQDLLITFPKDATYYRDQLGSKAYSEQFSQIAQEYLGFKPKIRVELATSETMEAPAARRERERREKEEATKKQAQGHPMITEARSLFGGELGPIELLESELQ